MPQFRATRDGYFGGYRRTGEVFFCEAEKLSWADRIDEKQQPTKKAAPAKKAAKPNQASVGDSTPKTEKGLLE